MTITNHVLAGSIIGVAIGQPVIALLVAFMSHFAMDALPHFGYPGNKGYSEVLKHRLSYQAGIATVITTLLVVILLIAKMKWLALSAGIVAALPDALGIYNYRKYEKHDTKATGVIKLLHVKFHRAIQWCERPWGIYIEAITAVVLTIILSKII